eukprot:2065092-Rhodomonas_salina.1
MNHHLLFLTCLVRCYALSAYAGTEDLYRACATCRWQTDTVGPSDTPYKTLRPSTSSGTRLVEDVQTRHTRRYTPLALQRYCSTTVLQFYNAARMCNNVAIICNNVARTWAGGARKTARPR